MNLNTSSSSFQLANSESFKIHLAKTYKNPAITVATKPQSNFVSNLICINQTLSELDFYNKTKRRKPYSTLKIREILLPDETAESGENGNAEISIEDSNDNTKEAGLVDKQVIIIDDSNDDIHKPWITPDLIKLIKQRNLLQAKLAEFKPEEESSQSVPSQAEAELRKQFKNLRNTVTKLVKKARSNLFLLSV